MRIGFMRSTPRRKTRRKDKDNYTKERQKKDMLPNPGRLKETWRNKVQKKIVSPLPLTAITRRAETKQLSCTKPHRPHG